MTPRPAWLLPSFIALTVTTGRTTYVDARAVVQVTESLEGGGSIVRAQGGLDHHVVESPRDVFGAISRATA